VPGSAVEERVFISLGLILKKKKTKKQNVNRQSQQLLGDSREMMNLLVASSTIRVSGIYQ